MNSGILFLLYFQPDILEGMIINPDAIFVANLIAIESILITAVRQIVKIQTPNAIAVFTAFIVVWL